MPSRLCWVPNPIRLGWAAFDYFGASVALSETTSIIGAAGDTIDSKSNQGSAYVFRNLEIATAIVNQHGKLTASDGAAYDGLGRSVALSGNIAIIGAGNKNFDEGAAYILRNLQAASGPDSCWIVKLTLWWIFGSAPDTGPVSKRHQNERYSNHFLMSVRLVKTGRSSTIGSEPRSRT